MTARPIPVPLTLCLGALCLGSPACETAPSSNPEPAAEGVATLVPNVEAKPGDTTTCPYSGRSFVVKADHPRVEYGGKTYWVCSDKAADEVRADPGKYLDDFSG